MIIYVESEKNVKIAYIPKTKKWNITKYGVFLLSFNKKKKTLPVMRIFGY